MASYEPQPYELDSYKFLYSQASNGTNQPIGKDVLCCVESEKNVFINNNNPQADKPQYNSLSNRVYQQPRWK